jgi:hypothetical protein
MHSWHQENGIYKTRFLPIIFADSSTRLLFSYPNRPHHHATYFFQVS